MSHSSELVHPKCWLRGAAPIPFLIAVEEEVDVPRRPGELEYGSVGVTERIGAIPVLEDAGIPSKTRCLGDVLLLGSAEWHPH